MSARRLAFTRSGAGALMLAAQCAVSLVHAELAREPVEDFRQLMMAAIDAPDGAAHGILIGPLAQQIGTGFRASGPILIDVATERRYRQVGCRRLKVSFSQEGVHLFTEAAPRAQTLDLGVDYCRDGSAPRRR